MKYRRVRTRRKIVKYSSSLKGTNRIASGANPTMAVAGNSVPERDAFAVADVSLSGTKLRSTFVGCEPDEKIVYSWSLKGTNEIASGVNPTMAVAGNPRP
jgi:hypothetical protein